MKLCNWLQNATAWTKIEVWLRPVVLHKNSKKWENFKTLQLTVECHSMNKKQSLIKMRPVVPEKNAKSEENLETLQVAAECHSINKIERFIKIKPVVPKNNSKKMRNFAIGCRVPQHEQKSKFDQDQTSSSLEKCKKWRKFGKHCNWLQSARA